MLPMLLVVISAACATAFAPHGTLNLRSPSTHGPSQLCKPAARARTAARQASLGLVAQLSGDNFAGRELDFFGGGMGADLTTGLSGIGKLESGGAVPDPVAEGSLRVPSGRFMRCERDLEHHLRKESS